MKNELINSIIEKEWSFFQRVQGIGGRASCQDNRHTFYIMRKSQFEVLPVDYLMLYKRDLYDAENQDRNPISEKYAYMMRKTDPEYFEKYLKDKLPSCSLKKKEAISGVMNIVEKWDRELREKYPAVAATMRPQKTTVVGVSPAFYLACELEACSDETVNFYYIYAKECDVSGRNLQIETVEETMKKYGFESILNAEKKLVANKDK